MEREVKTYKEKLKGDIKKTKAVVRQSKEFNADPDAEEIVL
jgi:hypothetical protein